MRDGVPTDFIRKFIRRIPMTKKKIIILIIIKLKVT